MESGDERINGVEVEFQNEGGVRVDPFEIEVKVQNEGVCNTPFSQHK